LLEDGINEARLREREAATLVTSDSDAEEIVNGTFVFDDK
jgi:hypothetical protein